MKKRMLTILAATMLIGCSKSSTKTEIDTDTDANTDTDTNTDTDADADTDTDTDVDTDTDTGTDTDTDTDVDTDTDTDTDTDVDTDTDTDVDTDTDTDTDTDVDTDIDTDTDADADTEADAGTDASVEPVENRWVEIAGGTFTQGSEEDLELDIDYTVYPMPTPEHTVTVPDFSIQKTEVTLGQYNACIAAGVCTVVDSEIPTLCASYNAWNDADRVNHPVDCVSYPQATQYCEWIGGRLPTESEWEYAARSQGKDYARPWGNTEATCEYAAMEEDGKDGCGTEDVWPVCSFPKGNTEQGLCDMVGNVFEITADVYHRTYEGAPSDGSAWMDGEDEEGSRSAARGSSISKTSVYLRTTVRGLGPHLYYERKGLGRCGFRCAK